MLLHGGLIGGFELKFEWLSKTLKIYMVGRLVGPENQAKRYKVAPGYPHIPWGGCSSQHVHGITLHADLHLHVAHAIAWTPHNVSHSTLV